MYFTEQGVSIQKNVEDKKTKLFLKDEPEYRRKAKKHAQDIRSYCFEVYTKNRDNKTIYAGMAVPK